MSRPAPLSAARVASASVGLAGLAVDGDAVVWLESRPAEGGRSVLVRWLPGEGATDLIPPPWNVRTRVHEYGGGAFMVAGGVVCFSHLNDQRLYRVDPGSRPWPLTPEGAWRFADGVLERRRGAIYCVGEHHGPGEPENCLVRVDLARGGDPVVVARGHDFYAAPRPSPDGASLAWLAWRHPDMPWDGTELWLARIAADGTLHDARAVAGGREESILEPLWTPDGALHVVSDRTGWWNLHRLEPGGLRALCPLDAEFARPPWVFGLAHHAVLEDGTVLCALRRAGRWRLGCLVPGQERLEEIETPYTDIGFVHAAPGGAVFVGASSMAGPAVVRFEMRTRRCTELRPPEGGIDPALVSAPEPVAFASTGGRVAHGLLHRPAGASPGGGPPR